MSFFVTAVISISNSGYDRVTGRFFAVGYVTLLSFFVQLYK